MRYQLALRQNFDVTHTTERPTTCEFRTSSNGKQHFPLFIFQLSEYAWNICSKLLCVCFFSSRRQMFSVNVQESTCRQMYWSKNVNKRNVQFQREKRTEYQGRMSIECACQHCLMRACPVNVNILTRRCDDIKLSLSRIQCTIIWYGITCSADDIDTSMIIISTVKYLWKKKRTEFVMPGVTNTKNSVKWHQHRVVEA